MQNVPRFLAAGLLIAGAVVVTAAPNEPAAAASPAPAAAPAVAAAGKTQTVAVADFSQGFAGLHRMGVTNVAKAVYVTLSGAPYVMATVQGRWARYGMKGNAWQLSGDSTNGLFLINETMLVQATTAKPANSNRADQVMMRYGSPYGHGYYEVREEDDESTGGMSAVRKLYDAKWKPADLQADLDSLLAKLQKEADKFLKEQAKQKGEGVEESDDPMMRAQMQMRMQMMVSGGDIGAWVACLLRAAHMADQGHLPEANRLAALAMTLGGGNKTLLEAVMDRFGNEAYQKVWAQFHATGDWKAYAAGIDGVAARFPRGWQQLAAARDLASRVRAFEAAGARPAPLKTTLRPADQALADALATAPATRATAYAWQQNVFWVLPRDTNDFTGAWVATNAHPLACLLRSGTNAIPVLLALLDDSTTFTRLQTSGALPSTNEVATAEDMGEEEMMRIEMERERMRWGGMPGGGAGIVRPALRSEIATQLLKALVGEDQNAVYSSRRGRRMPPQGKSLAERVHLWQEKHAGMSVDELAFACATGKDYNQRSQAMQYLATSSSTAVCQRLEKHFLGSANLDDDQWLVQTYVSRRGKEAKPFVDALEARIVSGALPTNALKVATTDGGEEEELFKAENAHDPSSNKYRIQQQQRMLKELRRIVDAKPLDVVVDEIATGKISPEAGRVNMARSFYETPYARRMEIALRGAAKAQAPDVRISLLRLVPRPDNQRTAQYETYMAGRGGVPPDTAEPPSAAALADVWRALLADARPSTNPSPNYWHPPLTVRETAAMSMELVYGRPTATELNARVIMDELGTAGLQLLLQRAESRLVGATSVQPPLPDPASVSASRLTELTNALPRAALGARTTQIAGLDMHTRLALARAARTNAELTATLAPVAHRMRVVMATNTPEKARAALQACEGKVLDATVLQGLVRQCDELAKQGQSVTFELLRRAGFDGVDVVARVAQPGDAIGSDPVAGVGMGVETLDTAPETLLLHPGAPVPAPGAADVAEDPLKRPTDAELIAAEIARLQRGPMTAAEAEASFWKRMATLCVADPAIGFPAGIRITPVK